MASSDELATLLNIAINNASVALASAAKAAEAQVEAAVKGAEAAGQAQERVAQVEAGWRNNANDSQRDVAHTTADGNVDAARVSSENDKSGRVDAAKEQRAATEHAADADKEGRVDAAKEQRAATEYGADRDENARIQAATAAANAQITAANSQANADITVASTRSAADQAVATITTANQVNVANIEAAGRNQVATTTGQFGVQAANVEAGGRTQSAGIEAEAAKYGADKQLAAATVHETAETGRLNLKLDFANDKFALLQPLLDQIITSGSSFLDGLNGGGQAVRVLAEPQAPLGFRSGPVAGLVAVAAGGDGDALGFARSTLRMGPIDPPQDGGTGGGGSTAGNVSVTAPFIGTRGVLTPAQLQQQVNQAYARNDSRTQALIRQAQGDLAGRGFSANSPILDALKVGYITGNLRASIEAASQIRLQAAQANADAVFRSQQARSEQYLAQENVLLEAEKNVITRQVGVLNAISSLVGGIL